MRKYRNIVCVNGSDNRKLYGIWKKMIERCTDKTCDRYKDYGGRGISMCHEWLDDFDEFCDWAKAHGYASGLTIDRIDNDGNYSPENCRWVTKREQNRNKRTNLLVEYRGETKPLIEWCEELGLRYDPIHNRITKGWDVEKAFNTPLASEYESFASICRRHNINQTTVMSRINKFGWTLEEALNTPSLGRGTHKPIRRVEAVCPICGKTFMKNIGKQKYCSGECNCKAKRRKSRKAS